jgi:hypothetical protein
LGYGQGNGKYFGFDVLEMTRFIEAKTLKWHDM